MIDGSVGPFDQGLAKEVGRATASVEALGWLGRLAIAHPDHPEMIGVPVHPELELLDTGLRFGIAERNDFRSHVELHI